MEILIQTKKYNEFAQKPQNTSQGAFFCPFCLNHKLRSKTIKCVERLLHVSSSGLAIRLLTLIVTFFSH
ncbi:hypothetical protein BGP_2165 [Beggiatoa sp. PS]|nr:hypothetical protein BGP_2165 [Beggiatoa sp. PS]